MYGPPGRRFRREVRVLSQFRTDDGSVHASKMSTTPTAAPTITPAKAPELNDLVRIPDVSAAAEGEGDPKLVVGVGANVDMDMFEELFKQLISGPANTKNGEVSTNIPAARAVS